MAPSMTLEIIAPSKCVRIEKLDDLFDYQLPLHVSLLKYKWNDAECGCSDQYRNRVKSSIAILFRAKYMHLRNFSGILSYNEPWI